jgi:hypothetical protein
MQWDPMNSYLGEALKISVSTPLLSHLIHHDRHRCAVSHRIAPRTTALGEFE